MLNQKENIYIILLLGANILARNLHDKVLKTSKGRLMKSK